ncbi:MAG: ABC transporter permease [Lachnospiraceae bacterium]|nr:ABC transporter permease [Lachnospiraceae bacterium]
MGARVTYLKLELKRAFLRLPQMLLGAAALVAFMGAAVLLASGALYGSQAAGRIAVGVLLPERDAVARQAVSMISSLESVKSLCDFSYPERDEAMEALEQGELYAVLEVPDGFVEDIINGTNTPVRIYFKGKESVESQIFKELSEAGAATLGASQAGIYAGDELLVSLGISERIPLLEEDLNRIFLRYSLPRMDYFRKHVVSAAGDVETPVFYGISMAVLFLLFGAIPVSGYLMPPERVMQQKLSLLGVGPVMMLAARCIGLTLLLFAVAFPVCVAAGCFGLLSQSFLSAGTLLFVCMGASCFVVFVYQAAGSLLGGVMLLFLAVTAMHFGSGGFLPLVFLPRAFRTLAPFLPSHILMEGMKMIVTESFEPLVFGKLLALAACGFAAGLLAERRTR